METPRAERARWTAPVLRTGLAALWVGSLFVSAGTLAWTRAWVYLATLVAGLSIAAVYVKRRNPVLGEVRRRVGPGTKSWDKAWLAVFWTLMLATGVVAGLDAVRWRWSAMSPWLLPLGAVALALGYGVSARAMAVNPHFEGTVRIQKDRDHRVIDAGPYRTVRHPGYAGIILWALGTPLLLGSWWAYLPAGITVAWVVVRTALEDGTLQRELDGYAEYCQRTRFRLVPHVW